MIESPQKADRKQKEKARNPHDSWLFWQGQKDSNPRHAVLEWMWKRHERTYNSQFSARLSGLCFQNTSRLSF